MPNIPLSRHAAAIALLALCACSPASKHAEAQMPEWLEPDSAQAIHQRMLRDFSLTLDQAVEQIAEKHPGFNIDSLRLMADKHYVEIITIDGQERMHRRSVRNVDLLNPDYNGGWKHRGWDASPQRLAYADSVMQCSRGASSLGSANRVRARFSIDVPWHPALAGDSISVWMPFPVATDRQADVALISSVPADNVITPDGASAHSTLFARQYMPTDSCPPLHFEYVAEYTAKGAYFDPEFVAANLKPYDTQSDLYKNYTAFDSPHIIRLDSLANAIVGAETNPLRQSELVYDYIISRYPWAGAREYSTIPCIPQYVIDEGHGDCGQVALLYISLMRSLGVPARWESGWYIMPGDEGIHDWAETYYEGIGWVPADVSFGRLGTASDPALRNFYSTGIDAYRFVANKGIGDAFFPPKKFMRSETVDSQLGEVECSKGNLFYPGWSVNYEILSLTPVEQ